MLIKFGLKEFKKDFVRNIPVILQMAFIMFITIACVTSVLSRYKYFAVFEDYTKQKGCIVYAMDMRINGDMIKERLHNVKDVAMTYKYAGIQLNIDSPLIYDDTLMEHYKPELVAGDWVIENNKKQNVQVMVNEKSGYHVGDVIEVCTKETVMVTDEEGNYTGETEIVFGEDKHYFEVAGVYSDTAKLLLFNPGIADRGENDYRLIFSEIDSFGSSSSSDDSDSPLSVIMSKSEALKFCSDDNCAPTQITFVVYNDSITNVERMENGDVLAANCSQLSLIIDNETFYEESWSYCFKQVYALVPILVGVLLLFIISMISVNGISIVRRMRNYTIFRLCGLTKQNCIAIAMTKSVCISLTAFVLSLLLIPIQKYTDVFDSLLIEYGAEQFLFCLAFVLLNLLITYLMSSIILNSAQINNTLKGN